LLQAFDRSAASQHASLQWLILCSFSIGPSGSTWSTNETEADGEKTGVGTPSKWQWVCNGSHLVDILHLALCQEKDEPSPRGLGPQSWQASCCGFRTVSFQADVWDWPQNSLEGKGKLMRFRWGVDSAGISIG
jgi:hypothetical protein